LTDPLGLACKEQNPWNRFQQDIKGHFTNSGEASASYRRMKEVQAMDKADKPDPSRYLPQSYIDAHLDQFEGGASRFMTKSNLEKYVPGQRDGTSFVMPSHEADTLMSKAAGDQGALAESLGLPRKMLEGNELVRVDFENPKELGLRMPAGTEAGANEYWLAGGKLPDGSSEAVIDVGGVPSSRYSVKSVKDK
jgi:hypothetical protein